MSFHFNIDRDSLKAPQGPLLWARRPFLHPSQYKRPSAVPLRGLPALGNWTRYLLCVKVELLCGSVHGMNFFKERIGAIEARQTVPFQTSFCLPLLINRSMCCFSSALCAVPYYCSWNEAVCVSFLHCDVNKATELLGEDGCCKQALTIEIMLHVR